jgi:hypothetical protein
VFGQAALAAVMPSPAQWVNVERIRVKDSFTHVWWMSPTERTTADNRKVLTQYRKDMKELLAKRSYNCGKVRPSGHRIGKESFFKDNGGAIPLNVFIEDENEPGTSLCTPTPCRPTGTTSTAGSAR